MNTTLLRKLSLAYLLLPHLLFVLGWFRIQYSIPIALGFLYLFGIETFKKQDTAAPPLLPKEILFLVLFSLVWAAVTGVGNLSYQTIDHVAHNAKYYDLYKNPWPMYFAEKGQYACYYFSYYLVPALFSKVTNQLSIPALVIWTALGFALGLAWIFLLINKSKRLLVVFLCIGGIGHFLKTLIYRSLEHDFHIVPFTIEIWSVFEQSLWVPNQVITSILLVGIVLHDTFIRKKMDESFFPITLGFTWAIFPSMVLVFLFGIVFFQRYWRHFNQLFGRQFVNWYLLPGLLFLPTFVYLLSSDGLPVNGFIWSFDPLSEIFLEYTIEIVIDCLVLITLTLYLRPYQDTFPSWFMYATFGLFVVMSQYRIGLVNDWLIRGTIPVFCVIGVFLLRGVHTYFRKEKPLLTPKPILLLLFLVSLGMVVPTVHLGRALYKNAGTKALFPDYIPFEPYPFNQFPNTYEAIKYHWGKQGADEYLANKNSFYVRYLAR
ncbi:hypothetical protein [Telluribacter sp.]|uniref:hypothetical protein n=1 Tax=Telluribacter sp. TaxID=1978767 RepID=UPI002E1341CF|nr:hypothetical protein [Telluribacter sp.]